MNRATEWIPALCKACGQAMPAQPYAGNPRLFGCEACRVWARRNPGRQRTCERCVAPTEDRTAFAVYQAQSQRRSEVNTHRKNGSHQ